VNCFAATMLSGFRFCPASAQLIARLAYEGKAGRTGVSVRAFWEVAIYPTKGQSAKGVREHASECSLLRNTKPATKLQKRPPDQLGPLVSRKLPFVGHIAHVIWLTAAAAGWFRL
jgi:hypothetical protein